MDNLGAMTTVMLLVMIAAVPYVWRIHHSSQKFLAAYLIFAVIFLTAFFALFNGALYLLTSLGRTPADLSIGTFCHENGHLLCRFPDMYDYGERDGDSIPSAGIGSYCLMGAGNHNGNGRSPSPVCAYLRDLAGWCDNEVDLSQDGAKTAHSGDYNTVMKYRTSRDNEYFLVENRTRMGLDRELPASGLAVYHCDIFGSNELQQGTASRHYQCALLQADGRRDLELNHNRGDGDDLFGAAAGLVLSGASNPSTREWDGRDSGLLISDISAPGTDIGFSTGQAQPQIVTATGSAKPGLKIPDNDAAGVVSTIAIAESGVVGEITVDVDIRHTYIGDLEVRLIAPSGLSVMVHPRLGGWADDLDATYGSSGGAILSPMIGQPMQGDWALHVADRAWRDKGTLREWSIELKSTPAGPPLVAAASGYETRARKAG